MIKEVIKADGSVEPFDLDKLSKWAKYSSKSGINWSILAVETFTKLPERCSSADIHQAMIDVCYSKQDINYSRVASRLETATIRKNIERVLGIKVNKASFKEIRQALLDNNVWDKNTIPPYSKKQDDLFEELKQINLESWQVSQWADKYLLKLDGVVVETPAVASIGIALGLHGDTQDAYDLASDIVNSRVNLPTPVLNGIRNGDFNGVSCCVISAGDSVESIEVAQHLAVRMTAKKAGIGVDFTTRSKGSKVKGGAVEHLGKHTIYKHLDSGVKEFTQVSRGGSATVSFTCIDPECYSIALWKSQRIDIEQRLDKLDYSFVFNDAFIDAVVNRKEWMLFDYQDAPKVYQSFYVDDIATYNSVVADEVSKGTPCKSVQALDLIKHILLVRQETGRLYCFNVSRANTHTPFKDTIRLSNLCVAPETMLLTKVGYQPIGELDGETVEVWNGKEWSETTVVKTGTNQKLVRVETNFEQHIDCTEYHKFYVHGGKGVYIEKRAYELKEGDKLIKFDLPVIDGEKELSFAYTNGFYTGDGTFDKQRSKMMTYLYHDKRDLLAYIEDVHNVCDDVNQKRIVVTHKGNIKPKYFVPTSDYSIRSRLDWLAGLCDSDGTVSRNGDNESLQIGSIHLTFLQEVQLMLQTLGVTSTINNSCDAGYRELPLNDGSGENGLFYCQQAWRLLINSNGLFQLSELGFKTHRLKWVKRRPHRECNRFMTIKSVTDLGRIDDTYCLNEPKRHMVMFNGMLTGQCQEICLPTKPYHTMKDLYSVNGSGETAFCSLSALVPSNIKSDDEYKRVAYTTVKTINTLILKCPKMTDNHERTMLERMSLGVGITGLAEYLYQHGKDYDGSEDSLEFVADLAEKHMFYLYSASCKLAKENGIGAIGVDFNWLPVDTKINKYTPKKDWESLRGKPRINSVLVAHMPTESSSLASGVTNGLYPPRQRIINKKSRKGVVQFICESFVDGVNLSAWDIDNIALSKYYSVVQDYTDQAISADDYFDPRKFDGGKKPTSQLVRDWVAHFKLGNKSMYYTNTYDNDEVSLFDIADDCESCKL